MCAFWQAQSLAHSGSNKRLNWIDYGIKVKAVAADQGPALYLAPKHIAKLKLESGGWRTTRITTFKQVCSDGEMQSQLHLGPLVMQQWLAAEAHICHKICQIGSRRSCRETIQNQMSVCVYVESPPIHPSQKISSRHQSTSSLKKKNIWHCSYQACLDAHCPVWNHCCCCSY